jgi:alanine racemase
MSLSWIEISKLALLNNIAQIKKQLSKKTKFIAVVKSNAYGHGILEVASEIENDVDYLASYHFEDLLLLRKNKITKPLLAMGFVSGAQIKLAIKNKIELSVSSLEVLEDLLKISTKNKILIHLCLDTGLGRDGFIFSNMSKVLSLVGDKNIEVKALYTHFAAPDSSAFNNYSKKQIAELMLWKKSLAAIGIKPLIHVSSTAATFISDFETHFDMVRIGGGIYGLWPSKEVEIKNKKTVKLLPVLQWKAKIVELKYLPKGSHISYGCTFTLKRDSKIAILPVGYFDGIPRISSGKSHVLVSAKKAPQLGRVTMNMIIIDVTDIEKVQVGDIATIIGKDKKEVVSAQNWGEWAGSFNYEITTRINANLPRVLVLS